MPKYPNSKKAINSEEFYSELFESRGVEAIEQYRTMRFGANIASKSFPVRRHTWSIGDKYYKLSYEHYGTLKYWWVIALFNAKPTDAHVEYGDEILIPYPVDVILREI